MSKGSEWVYRKDFDLNILKQRHYQIFESETIRIKFEYIRILKKRMKEYNESYQDYNV